jgi:hypothetical protein
MQCTNDNVGWSGRVGFLLMKLLVASMFVQITIVTIAQRSLNLYHLLIMGLSVLLVLLWLQNANGRVTRAGLLASLFLLSLALPMAVGWQTSMANVLILFGAGAFFLGLAFGRLPPALRLRVYAFSAGVFFVAVLIRDVAHVSELHAIYSRARGCSDCYLATGGINIEATMFALLAILYRGRYRRAFGLMMTVTVLLFQSRIGLIGATIFWFSYFMGKGLTTRMMMALGLAAGMMIAVLVMPDLNPFARFSIQDELVLQREGVGRLALWNSAQELIPKNPFGIGPGNAVDIINHRLGTAFWENNIHNVYLTWILELGWLHGLLLGGLVLLILWHSRDGLEFYAILFLVLGSLFEFTGYDGAYWFFFGVATSEAVTRKQWKRMSRSPTRNHTSTII